MRKKRFLIGVVLLVASLLVTGCGIPQEDYDAVVAERDAVQTELQSVSSELERKKSELESTKSQLETIQGELETVKSESQSVQSQLNSVKSQLQSTNSQLSSKNSQLSSLAKKLELGKQILRNRSAILRVGQANRDGNNEEEERQNLLALDVFKSYDSLVSDIGDSELGQHWGGAWPQGAREDSEEAGRPMYVYRDYANFLDRLIELIEAGTE